MLPLQLRLFADDLRSFSAVIGMALACSPKMPWTYV